MSIARALLLLAATAGCGADLAVGDDTAGSHTATSDGGSTDGGGTDGGTTDGGATDGDASERRYDGGVVLFHDIHQYTADELDAFILAARSEGYTFAALDDAEAFPNLNAGTPHDFPWLGEPCQVGEADQCWQVEYLSWCEPAAPDEPGDTAGICTIGCEGYCLDRAGAATTFCATVPPETGQCTSYSHQLNEYCALVPGTGEWTADR